MKNNFFYISRDLLHSDRWLSEPFTRGQAWVDMFGLAQHADSFIRIRGIRVDLKRGQLGYSQVTLAKRWRWSRNKVRRYLFELEKHGDVKQQKNEVTTLITIVKYDYWQTVDTTNDTTNDTTEGQQKDSKRYTNNKDNNVNNVNTLDTTVSKGLSPEVKENFYITFNETWKKIFGKNPVGGAILCQYPVKRLVQAYGIEKVCGVLIWLESNRDVLQYAPTINNPLELERKWNSIIAAYRKENQPIPSARKEPI